MSWQQRAIDALKRGWPLVLVPLSYIGFVLYRDSLMLPSLTETQHRFSYIFLSNPLEGMWVNLRWYFTHLPESLMNVDFLAILSVPILCAMLIGYPRHRHLSLIVYSVAFSLLFISKINWQYGTEHITASASFGRYSLCLFPLTILVADIQRSVPRWGRFMIIVMLILGLLLCSAQHALGMGPV